ncbi:hypothetical protein DdX_12704 [Ditylenchus destructor]|uniref:OTU domain-containing protein n=1 Tax=Ditylenchus destructor TaxID=166010 RepID=A0AAD4MUP1_9BILA|nr:hypothetical protein DdX_12704 [Ditylenchus destructor]
MKPKTQVFRRSKSLTDLATNTQQTRSNLAEKAENNNANETVPKGKRQIYKVVPSTDPVHLDHSTHYSRGNCYYRALSVRVTGSEMNHEGLRKAIMCFGEARKMEDPLIAQLYEITEITPSKRKTAATGHKDTDHYARFPLDFVLAAKCLQVNIIVYNDDHEWEVYRPDATSCRPLVEVPQEEIPSIALEYNCDHVTLVNTIG